jgi:hypothetical protein
MKNVVLKTCLTSLVLSMSGLAAATGVNVNSAITNTLNDFSTDDGDKIEGYSAISGGALSVAEESIVTGHVAAQAAVTIGADTTLGTVDVKSNVSAGAAVSIGALAKVGNIYAAAAAGVAANARVGNIKAGAAVTLGAPANALDITAGAAITLGAGSFAEDVQAAAAITGAVVNKDSQGNAVPSGNVDSMTITSTPASGNGTFDEIPKFDISGAMTAITIAQNALSDLAIDSDGVIKQGTKSLGTYMGTNASGAYLSGVYAGSALNIPADSTITFSGDAIINLSDALTLGANTKIVLQNGASVIWNVGSALNLGAGTKFAGTAFVNGSVSGATADVCGGGSLYAKGALAIGSISKDCQ